MPDRIDINSDMGESFGLYRIGNDEEMMKQVTSANIACGFHAGDPHVMKRTVSLAKKYGVAVGAHPGYPDPIGFGRRRLEVTPEEAGDYILYQVGALRAFCEAAGLEFQHVKPHGQLYNMAWKNESLARGILEAVRQIKRDTRRYAKRQWTWFKGDPEIGWRDESVDRERIFREVTSFLRGG